METPVNADQALQLAEAQRPVEWPQMAIEPCKSGRILSRFRLSTGSES
jgi:hypothetical protein